MYSEKGLSGWNISKYPHKGRKMGNGIYYPGRRRFLKLTMAALAGGLLGVDPLAEALAYDRAKKIPYSKTCIAVIIDDIGYNRASALRFLDLGIPITFSILPRLQYSEELAAEMVSKGHEIMLHQPMEPRNRHMDPGPGALYVGYERERIRGILEENISSLPEAIGMNNHMGSRFTECPAEMKEVLEIIKGNRLFFVDSVTTARSIAEKTAENLGLDRARRNIFIDNQPAVSNILAQMEKLKKYALIHGSAIAIGHPHKKTADALMKFLENLKDPGISFDYASNLVKS